MNKFVEKQVFDSVRFNRRVVTQYLKTNLISVNKKVRFFS